MPRVPVKPNKCLVHIEVFEVLPKPNSWGSKATVRVKAVISIPGEFYYPPKVGEVIEVFVPPDMVGTVQVTENYSAYLTYRGDAHNGAYAFVDEKK